MMEQTESGFFIIDAWSLRQVSRRPCHLEQRFLQLHRRPMTNAMESAEVKRQALLEARRKKLHERFAEIQRVAEEVKTRKEHRHLDLLRSLESAEMNRERFIEQRRAANKELVNRAKVVALQRNRQYEAEQERRRLALEHRLEASHVRRQRILRLPKSRQIPALEPNPQRGAVKSVQTRKSQSSCAEEKNAAALALAVHHFKQLELPLVSVPDSWLSFRRLAIRIHASKVVQCTAKLLNLALPAQGRDPKRQARVLLSAYMILMCTADVFQDPDGTSEQELIVATKQMLTAFEQWLEEHSQQPSTRLAFEECWNGFYALFEAWKSGDRQRLVANMSMYYLELIRLMHTLGAQDSVMDIHERISEQATQVKNRVERLGGQDAVDALVAAEQTLEQEHHVPASADSSPEAPSLTSQVSEDQANSTPSISADDLMRLLGGYAAGELSNERLAHEVIVNPDFRLQKSQPFSSDDMRSRIKAMATRAFFDQVQEELENGQPEKALPLLFNDIRSRLLGLVRPGSSLHQAVQYTLNVDNLVSQIEGDTFDLHATIHKVLDLMLKICAPVRDEEIRHIREQRDPIEQIQAVLDTLDEMTLDLANIRLQALRPHLIPIAVEYERSRFADALTQGSVGLAKTRRWFRDAMARLDRAAEQRQQEKSGPSTSAVFDEAFVAMMIGSEPINRLNVPETWLLDVENLANHQNEIQAITMVAALIILAKNFGASDQWDALAKRYLVMLEDHSTDVDDLTAEIVRRMDPNTSSETRAVVRSMIDKTLLHHNTVYSLLARRVGSVLCSYVQTGQSLAPGVLASYGLEPVQEQLEALCQKLMPLVRHHRQVYAPWYDDMIADKHPSSPEATTTTAPHP